MFYLVGAAIICIEMIMLYKLSQKSFIVDCMSNSWVKFNSNCIILVVLVVNNFRELSLFWLYGAKLLWQTAKTCQYDEKNAKKMHFFIESAFF